MPQLIQRIQSLINILINAAAAILHGVALVIQSRSALVAENIFLRKQLALYQERQTRPRRLTDAD